ncbi:MAG: NAD-dependent epimerase/dehydratase family protein [Acidiferrobacteraceae bacterium]
MTCRVLVTGADGFVGACLVRTLERHGFCVRAAVRVAGRRSDAVRDTVSIGAIGADTRWDEALANIGVVVHLAARVHVMNESLSDPVVAYTEVNVRGTEQLARAAVRARVSRLIYVSSIKVLGENTDRGPFTPSHVPAPVGPYAISKWEAEQVLRRIELETGLDVVVVRPPLVYGPNVKGNFLRLLQWVERGLPLPVAACRHRRTLLGLENFVDVLLRCVTDEQAQHGTFLVGDDKSVSTSDLVRTIAHTLGRRPPLIWCPTGILKAILCLTGRRHVYERLCGPLEIDIAATSARLQWKPPRSMEEGVQATVMAYQRRSGG